MTGAKPEPNLLVGKCPMCGSYDIGTSAEQWERGDVEMVTCRQCGNVTDAYEAWKQAGGVSQ